MRVLVAEDDTQLSQILMKSLMDDGFAVDSATDGQEANFLAESEDYDAIILDLGMPIIDGLTILGNIRSRGSQAPVLILTGRNQEEDKVAGLNAGADDYLTKPFSLRELRARINALLRRSQKEPSPILQVGNLELDPVTHKVFRNGQSIDLSPKEFAVLEFLMRHKDEVVTRTKLLEHVWDYNFEGISNVVDVFVSYLRKKVDANGHPKLIHTIHGVGFKISENPSSGSA